MNQKRIAAIHDISCFGRCSLTVALPIISAAGIETAVIPTAVLSTHTGGFTGYTFRDLTDDILPIAKHWQKEGIKVDAVYSGYLGSKEQIRIVKEALDYIKKDGAIFIADPAMADNGKLYTGFDDGYVAKMRELCAVADVVLPNVTEASLLTGLPYRESYDEEYTSALTQALLGLGAKSVVLTGISYKPGTTGVLVWENGSSRYYCHEKLAKSFHGTGDIYSSAFSGMLLCGRETFEAAKIAADFTVACMRNTMGDDKHWYGVKFEPCLSILTAAAAK